MATASAGRWIMLHARVAGRSILTTLAIVVCLLASRPSYSGSGVPLVPPVVVWSFDDNVSACPAGDSVFAGHPARLRVQVNYYNSSGQPRNGVPPESIWVEVWTNTGNIVVSDQTLSQLDRTQVFADDSTRGNGGTLITVPSSSGCGTLNVKLYVSGVNQGTRVATI